jgi:hypothetical protein
MYAAEVDKGKELVVFMAMEKVCILCAGHIRSGTCNQN